MGIFDGFAESFNPAYQNSLARWQTQQNADREFALRQQQHNAEMEERGLRTAGLRRVDEATRALTEAQTRGIGRNTGLGMATEPEYDASAVQYKPASEEDLFGLQRNLAAAKGDIEGLSRVRKDADAYGKDKRKKDTFKKYSAMKDEELLQVPELRALLNDNPKVKGSVGYDEKTKSFYATDYKGDGGVHKLTRAELMDAAMQLFDESEGDVDSAIARGRGRYDRARGILRQDAGDDREGKKTAHSMNMDQQRSENDTARLGIDRARLGIARQQLDASNWVPEQYVDKDGKVRIFDVNRKGAQPQFRERTMPEGLKPYSQRDPLLHAQLVKYYTDAGMPMPQALATADARLGGEDPTKRVLEALQKLNESKGKDKGAPQSKQAPRTPEDRIGNGPIGLFTPRSHIEEAAGLGNSKARSALDTLNQNDVDVELNRQGLYYPR